MADYEPVVGHDKVLSEDGVDGRTNVAPVLAPAAHDPTTGVTDVEHSGEYASMQVESDATAPRAGPPAPSVQGPRRPLARAAGPSLAPPSPRSRGRVPAVSMASRASLSPGAPGGSNLPESGAHINQYELIRELGRGGMGAVYLARDVKLGRRVAIKLLQSSARHFTERFIIEARATAQCSHENIVVIYEVNEFHGNPYMVLEYLQGGTLTRQVAGKVLSASRAVQLMVPVVRALVCAHELGIVHRDLKPDNIFVTRSGPIKVLDFGIAKFLSASDGPSGDPVEADGDSASEGPRLRGLTRHGALVGTRSYMSPEQWGAGEIDHRTDLWAVGILLFRMVTGKHPLAPLRGDQLVVTRDLEQPMPRVASVRSDVPAALAEIIDHCLIKRKEQRMPDARTLLERLEPLLPGRYSRPLDTDESPYAGLTPFQESDADRFYGRSREIHTMLARLRDQPLMGVVGPSGTGKSSFVRAGVIPALKHSGETWEAHVLRPGRYPLASLANVVTPMITGESATLTDELSRQRAVMKRLVEEPGYLGAVLRSQARRQRARILLFVDQFEELYTLTPDLEQRRAFTACLAGMADDPTSPLRVVLSIRSDLLDRVAEDRRFMAELAQSLFFLSAPDRQSLRDALVRPAEMAGYRFESPAMVEQMIDALDATPAALPLLQFTASKLWDARDRGGRLLTAASYEALGGIAGALAGHANAVLTDLSVPAQGLIRAIFMRLVTPDRTRALVSMSELREISEQPDEVQHLVDHLVAARLLVVHGAAGSTANRSGSFSGSESTARSLGDSVDESLTEPMVEIVHESLLGSWPLLRRWLEENQEDAAFLDQLRTAARQWDSRGRPPGLLWRGAAMNEARRWHERYTGTLPGAQRAYLDAVFALATRAVRRRRLLVAGIIGFLSLLVAAGGVALVIIRDAQTQATEQAALARDAEKQVREKLELLEAKEREKQAAEAAATLANDQVEWSRAELQQANQRLRGALTEAEKASARAQREGVKSRESAEKAREASLEARRQAAEAKRANSKLERLLSREKARVKELERKLGGKIGERLK